MIPIPPKVSREAFAKLPRYYQEFYNQLTYGPQKPLHYVHQPGKWRLDEETGQMIRIHNTPIPIMYPAQFHEGLWGGEGIIRGYTQKNPKVRRFPKFWVPNLQKFVLYSEILDRHFETIVTSNLLDLIDKHTGFDSYILETPPQDLKSNLALKIKRKLLLSLATKDFYQNDPAKHNEIYEKYKKYELPLEEAEWYGLTLAEAMAKYKATVEVRPPPVPKKLIFRQEFIEQLKSFQQEKEQQQQQQPSSWFQKLNPFSGGGKTV
uniref:Large ribosomal subunit protein bL28m n=1 Tax=Lynceus sp. MCZ IZ 141354 TaxID=1930659 RepID=A0A9N6ZG91_9CRUS|nr:EOG090X0GHI [Lynceus sp. MCZ IZ 141354]